MESASMGGGDRLSGLPDSLLHNILSHLTALQVVRTCLLCSRWRHLWRSVPCLHVDSHDFRRPRAPPPHDPDDAADTADEDEDYYEYDDELSWIALEDFTDSLLTHRRSGSGGPSPPLDTFRLSLVNRSGGMACGACDNPIRPCRWVRRALDSCSTKVLDVSSASDNGINHHERHPLPPLLVVPGSGSSRRRRLTHLRLHNASLHFRDSTSTASFSAAFPALEAMELSGCHYGLRRIESPTLRSLAIHGDKCCNMLREPVAIAAPALASLRLTVAFMRDRESGCYVQWPDAAFAVEAPLRRLVDASVAVLDRQPLSAARRHQYHGGATLQGTAFFRTMRTLLGSLSNASGTLELSGFKATSGERPSVLLKDMIRLDCRRVPTDLRDDIALEFDKFASVPLLQAVLDEEQGSMPVFRNLRTLILNECHISNNLQTLWRLLRLTPLLEKLTLQCCKFPDDIITKREGTSNMSKEFPNLKLADMWCKDTDEVPKHLRLVEIKYKDRDEDSLDEALQEMSIKYKDQETLQRDIVSLRIRMKLPKVKVEVTKIESN